MFFGNTLLAILYLELAKKLFLLPAALSNLTRLLSLTLYALVSLLFFIFSSRVLERIVCLLRP